MDTTVWKSIGKTALYSLCGFSRPPNISYDHAKVADFERLANDLTNSQQRQVTTIEYKLPYPRYEFLRYLSARRGYLFHGSSEPDIHLFEPRPQTTFYGKSVRAVFATPDPIWPVFFAILNRNFVTRFRNGCFSAGPSRSNYYYFSVPNGMLTDTTWRDGTVYVVDPATFIPSDNPNEWISPEPVIPIAKLAVSPYDFPFLAKVSEYDPKDSMVKFLLQRAMRRI